MGPFPHDAPKATISLDNPAGTDGFEFLGFAHPEPEKLGAIFRQMGVVRGEDDGDAFAGQLEQDILNGPAIAQIEVRGGFVQQ